MTGSSIFGGGTPTDQNITIFLVQLIIVVVLSRVLTWLFRYIKREDVLNSSTFYWWQLEPSVIAEVVAGILLGPSALGRLPQMKSSDTQRSHFRLCDLHFPPNHEEPGMLLSSTDRNGSWGLTSTTAMLSEDWQGVLAPYGPIDVVTVFANFGLILFMFIIGLELDTSIMKKNLKEGLIISISAMALPFGFVSLPYKSISKLMCSGSCHFDRHLEHSGHSTQPRSVLLYLLDLHFCGYIHHCGMCHSESRSFHCLDDAVHGSTTSHDRVDLWRKACASAAVALPQHGHSRCETHDASATVHRRAGWRDTVTAVKMESYN